MKFTFAIALLAAVTAARRNGNSNNTDEFLDFAVKQGKNYQSVGEFQKCAKNFERNQAKVDRMNEKAEKLEKKRQRRAGKKAKRQANKLAKFESNFTSDMDDEEFAQMLGLAEPPARRLLDDVVPEEDGRRHLADNVDWVAAQKMAPVKNQGGCGSCWSFAAGTALEGSQAITYNTTPERLSEQSAVDCTSRTCQTGGWMNDAWNFWKSKGGAPSDAAYPYTGKNQACEDDKLNDPVAQVSSYKWVDRKSAAAALHDGPMTVALEAGSDCFRYYKSGILDAEEAASQGCGARIDHAVVLVAFTNAVEGTSGTTCTTETECTTGECWTEKVNCRVVEEAKCIDKSTCVTNRSKCRAKETVECTPEWKDAGWQRRATNAEKATQTCAEGGQTSPWKPGKAPNKSCDVYKWFYTRCSGGQDCTEAVEECDVVTQCPDEICNEVERCSETEGTEGTPAFWTLQNSWSRGWGDNGFMHVEATDDDMGILGMQNWMQQVFAA